MSKYHAVKTEVDGIMFDSKREAARYQELKLLERAGEISKLQLQPRFLITVNKVKIATYKADFCYFTKENCDGCGGHYPPIYEDVKGMTRGAAWNLFQIKRKLVEAIYGIEITVVK